MKMVMISETDARQVAAILNTHAEMQDQRSVENLELMSSLRLEGEQDHEVKVAFSELRDMNKTLDDDCDNLRRIAKLFN